MSTNENSIWLEEKKAEFEMLINSPSPEDIEKAYEIVNELYDGGFTQEAVELDDEWDTVVREVSPKLYQEYKGIEE